MNTTHITEPTEPEQQPEVDPIETVHTGECMSLTGRSSLTFAIGRHTEDGSLHLRIDTNSGGGMFCKDWAAATEIDVLVKGATELTSRSFQALHPGRSINTAGFVLASLKEMGLIRTNAENTRLHEHVPTTTFEKVAMAAMGQTKEHGPKTTRRKAKEA